MSVKKLSAEYGFNMIDVHYVDENSISDTIG